jgi:hypothetical protein
MSPYRINRTETWTLAILLHLPIQSGSTLSNWLAEKSNLPQRLEEYITPSLKTLAAKGYYNRLVPEAPLLQELVNALTLIALDQANITCLIRNQERSTMAQFAQAGDGLVQFGLEDEQIILHPPHPTDWLPGVLFTPALYVTRPGKFSQKLPLGAFLLFQHAIALRDLGECQNTLHRGIISKTELFSSFPQSQKWLDVYRAFGIQGIPSISDISLEPFLNQLLQYGFLQSDATDELRIGRSAQTLDLVLSDPDQIAVLVSHQTLQKTYPETGLFLYADGVLFLIEFHLHDVIIQQYSDIRQAQEWLLAILGKGNKPQPPSTHHPAAAVQVAQPAAPTSLEEQHTTIANLRMDIWSATFIKGDRQGETITLPPSTMGRSRDADLPLNDLRASRKHATLEIHPDGLKLTDLLSSNGTFVNGVKIQAAFVWEGDLVSIGETTFQIHGRQKPA